MLWEGQVFVAFSEEAKLSHAPPLLTEKSPNSSTLALGDSGNRKGDIL